MSKALDLKDQRFGRLVAKEQRGRSKARQVLWHCECDCGGFCIVPARTLRKGEKRSCGCLYRDTRPGSSARSGGFLTSAARGLANANSKR